MHTNTYLGQRVFFLELVYFCFRLIMYAPK